MPYFFRAAGSTACVLSCGEQRKDLVISRFAVEEVLAFEGEGRGFDVDEGGGVIFRWKEEWEDGGGGGRGSCEEGAVRARGREEDDEGGDPDGGFKVGKRRDISARTSAIRLLNRESGSSASFLRAVLRLLSKLGSSGRHLVF